MTDRPKPHFAYVECARGYAVLLVIICHTTYLFPNLPYPVHRVTVLGWHGVQLFFLASAVTLMMSWRHENNRNGSVDVAGFFLLWFLRIAPAYYLVSVLYFFLEPPKDQFDSIQALTTYLFINAWHPVLMGVAADSWDVVVGGWSIGVEFMFYVAFPLLLRPDIAFPSRVFFSRRAGYWRDAECFALAVPERNDWQRSGR